MDLLLDVAALGINYVEREGISFRHPSRFLLIGTMNPEEGDLRPQLLDRFALSVDITGIRDARDRVLIMERNIGYEADPEAFREEWLPREEAESELSYRARVQRSFLYGALNDTITKLKSKPFSRAVDLSAVEELDEMLRLIEDDADNARCSVTQFASAMFEDALVHGLTATITVGICDE